MNYKRESKLSFRLPFGSHGRPWKLLKIGPQSNYYIQPCFGESKVKDTPSILLYFSNNSVKKKYKNHLGVHVMGP